MEFAVARVSVKNTAMTNMPSNPPSQRTKAGVRRINKAHPRTDMTPMVDLAFLLITFFVFTAQISQPATMNLAMPHDGPPMPTGESKTITFLLGNNNTISWYAGDGKKVVDSKQVAATSYGPDGIRRILHQKQLQLGNTRDELMVLIKPRAESTYENVVNVLDEMTINGVKRYVVTEPEQQEKEFVVTSQVSEK